MVAFAADLLVACPADAIDCSDTSVVQSGALELVPAIAAVILLLAVILAARALVIRRSKR